MEDMHIHLKDAIYDQLLFNKYVSKCIDMNLSKVVFLDHGNRISPKHKAVLNTKEAIDCFSSLINEYRNNNLNKLEIIKGIEIDYSNDQKFRDETFKILDYGNFEWVVGAIHSIKFENDLDYYKAIVDMLNNYKINVIAHMVLNDNYKSFEMILCDILEKCKKDNVAIEINTSDRSRWNDEKLFFMLDLLKKYNVKYVYSSDAHKIDDIGYMIEETNRKVKQWKNLKK